MRVFCQLCGHEYAEVSLEGRPADGVVRAIAPLRYPLSGAMFGSPDPFHGIEPPFDPSLDWETFRCPMGRIHRPMATPDLVLTHKGMVRLPKDGGPAFLDPTARAEVDRESIGDRTIMVSDEEAERQARAKFLHYETDAEKASREALEKSLDAEKSGAGHGALAMGEFVELNNQVARDVGLLPAKVVPCPICKKAFPTEKQMKSHQGGAHRAKKRGK